MSYVKNWWTSKTNIAVLLTLIINMLNAGLSTAGVGTLIPADVLAIISGFVLPVVVFILRTWFTDTATTQPLGLFDRGKG